MLIILVSRLYAIGNRRLTSMRFVDCESGALHWAVLAKNQTLDTMVDALYQNLGPVTQESRHQVRVGGFDTANLVSRYRLNTLKVV